MVYVFARLCHFQLVPQFVKQNKNIRRNAITMEVEEAFQYAFFKIRNMKLAFTLPLKGIIECIDAIF